LIVAIKTAANQVHRHPSVLKTALILKTNFEQDVNFIRVDQNTLDTALEVNIGSFAIAEAFAQRSRQLYSSPALEAAAAYWRSKPSHPS
jgi:hypothetical protein